MPVLSEADRAEVTALFMQETSALGETFGAVKKPDIRAAVDATDEWRNANATSANQAIPQPARTALTANQKSRIMALIMARAYQKQV